jgi:hypothetical protein
MGLWPSPFLLVDVPIILPSWDIRWDMGSLQVVEKPT